MSLGFFLFTLMGMTMLYGIILSVTSIQGFIMGLYLLSYKDKKLYSNKLLSLLLFLLSYVIITEALRVFDAINYSRITYYFFLELGWLIGPSLYLYVKSLYRPAFRISSKEWPLFIPVIIQGLFSAFIKIQNLYWDGTRESLSWLGYHGYRLWVHTPVDLIVTSLLVIGCIFYGHKIIKEHSTNNYKKTDKSLLNILLIYFLFAIFAIVLSLVDFFFFNFAFEPIYVYPVYIGLGILTYWLAFHGVLSKDQIYVKKKVGDAQLAKVMRLLKESMEKDRHYLDPNLNVSRLSDYTGIKAYLISKAINNVESVSTSQFINNYRVREFVHRVNSKDHGHLTILSIALDCGFNSKASANRIIKSTTGKSPKELKTSLK